MKASRAILTTVLLGLSGAAMAAPVANDRKAPPSALQAAPVEAIADCTKADTRVLEHYSAGSCLREYQGWLYIRTFDIKTGRYWEDIPIEHDMLFGILATTSAAPLWPKAMAFIGEDGSRWRAALRTRAETLLGWERGSPGASLEHFVSASIVPALQAAELYWQAGDRAAARRVLREMRLVLEGRGAPADPDQQFDWISLYLREAKLEANAGDPDLAFSIFEKVLATPGLEDTYRANVLVNYAAYLAEFRRPQDALRILAEGEAAAGSRDGWVAGSERQFSWIRACALHQLGDKRGVKAAVEIVKDRSFAKREGGDGVMSTQSIQFRMAYCMGDDAEIAALSGNGGLYLYDPDWYLMQADIFSNLPGKDATRRRAAQRMLKGKNPPGIRQIPAALHPAMNYWQPQPSDLRPQAAPAAAGTRG